MPNILLVGPRNPETTFWSLSRALEIVGKKSAFPPLGLLTIAGMLPPEYTLRFVDLNVRELNPNDLLWADAALTSGMIIHWRSVETIIAECERFKVPVMCGGPLATQYHKKIKGGAVFFLGEAENGFLDALKYMLAEGEPKRLVVDRTGTFRGLAVTPLPRWDLIPDMGKYNCMLVQITRGCPESCTFCNIPALYGKTTRIKSRVVREFDALHAAGWRGTVLVVDDNFVGNADAILKTLNADIAPWQKEHDYPFELATQASIRLADNGALLRAMHEAGFGTIFAGIESPVEESLKFMGARKNLQGEKTLLQKVRRLQEWGFEVQAGFIMGLDTDPEDIAEHMLAFIREAGIPVAMVGPLGVLPDTPDWKRFEREGRLVPVEYAGDSGIFSRELSFIPKRGAEWLVNAHRSLVARLNSPEIFFERCITMYRHRNRMPIPRRGVGVSAIGIALRSMWKMGVVADYRGAYRRFLYTVARKRPQWFTDAIRISIWGHHLIETTRDALRADEAQTFMEAALAEFQRLASGSREAFTRAEAHACRLMREAGTRIQKIRAQGTDRMRRAADILVEMARNQCKAVDEGFWRQLEEHFQRFRKSLKDITEERA